MINTNTVKPFTKKKRISTYSWPILLLFILLVPKAAGSQTHTKVDILDKCRQLFGAAINTRESLFEIRPGYVLQVKFTSQGNLNALSIQPKYYLEDLCPEWTKPSDPVFLSKYEYGTLLTQLEDINPKGKLLSQGGPSVTTGAKTDYFDQYENAFLHRLEFAGENEIGVQSFGVYFLHEVSGVVDWKREIKLFGIEFYQISLNGCRYFVHERDYIKLKEGVFARLKAAGTIEGF